MTRQELESFKEFVRKYTAEHTKTKKAATETLIREGIYEADGKLKVRFGGKERRVKAA